MSGHLTGYSRGIAFAGRTAVVSGVATFLTLPHPSSTRAACAPPGARPCTPSEGQVPPSTALHSRFPDGGPYLTGPLTRYSLNRDRLSLLALEAADRAGLGPECRNPFRSILVRAVEIVYAVDEALRIIAGYEPPPLPSQPVPPQKGPKHSVTEAPRGVLYHRYDLRPHGLIRARGSSRRHPRTRPPSRTTCAVSSPPGCTSTTTP